MPSIQAFIKRWEQSSASERANAQLFIVELCDVLGVPHPDAAFHVSERDSYVFEKVVPTPTEHGLRRKRIDLYKEGCFILEAKQGGTSQGAPGTARRDSNQWHIAMQKAQGQALGYARSLERPPPFLIVLDVGWCFELYASFDGTANYHHFPTPQKHRIFLWKLDEHLDTLRAVFTDPYSLDPTRAKIAVTREVAARIAALASKLEKDNHDPVLVAKFLMRCLFTMFAEDVELLPEHLFTRTLQDVWIREPKGFAVGMETLWHSMNTGSAFGFVGKLLHFNGGLFSDSKALPLTSEQLGDLLAASKCDWASVEPAIFGTLLERALDKAERHKLGAHFTPRAYVERLVRPTIEEPVRDEWNAVRAVVLQLRAANKMEQARKEVHVFHRRLCSIRVLDPACGTGNFLYVTLDVFKRIESEIFQLLEDLGEVQQTLELHYEETVTPRQFLGIEVKPWAKEIAELVLWIGYLQWHFRTFGKVSPPEPVLHDHKNIECRDAVLAWDRIEPVLDEKGRVLTRWDGKTMKKHPVTGEDVPDESARVNMLRYVNARKAEWPQAEFIVGNPPFIGIARMRTALGDGYTEALRAAYPELPDSIDFVMYWWHKAAESVAKGTASRAGLITTKSITQTFNRRVIELHLRGMPAISLVYAVPNHPWVDDEFCADVRIAMTAITRGVAAGILEQVITEVDKKDSDPRVQMEMHQGVLHSDLRIGVDVTATQPLTANRGLSHRGMMRFGDGFLVNRMEAQKLGLGRVDGLEQHLRVYRSGRDLASVPRDMLVIDLYGLTPQAVQERFPEVYQWVLERVKPERDQNRDARIRNDWWLHGRPRPELRAAIAGMGRYLATVETSKHRYFVFLDASVLPDNKLIVLAFDDAYALGVVSSRIHVTWAIAMGSRLGVGNDPVYVKTACFDRFPFPVCTQDQASRIRAMGETLDAHRKQQQEKYPALTITGMYNILEKLRAGEPLSAKDKVIHEQGLVSVLKQIHDDLDAAVFDAYGWPQGLTDEQILEKLVTLNAERAEEEKGGLIRWLRPEFQNPSGKADATQFGLAGVEDASEADAEGAPPSSARAWPKKRAEQITAVRDLLVRSPSAWSEAEIQGAFKGAKRKEVAAALETLAALGMAVVYGEGASARYCSPGRSFVNAHSMGKPPDQGNG